MSGIDEIGMESCECTLRIHEADMRQYWQVSDRNGRIIGYLNPLAFREYNGERRDEYNPAHSIMRDEIVEEPEIFISSIKTFCCNTCGNNIEEGTSEFNTKKKRIFAFVTGDVFPTLRKGE